MIDKQSVNYTKKWIQHPSPSENNKKNYCNCDVFGFGSSELSTVGLTGPTLKKLGPVNLYFGDKKK